MAIEVSARSGTLSVVTASGDFVIDFDELQGAWTTEQYLKLSNNSSLLEFTDGNIEVLPVTTYKRQKIIKFLLFLLQAFLQKSGGEVIFSPLRLQIRPGKFREPDLLVALDANDSRLQNEYWLGADLVVEVVSPDNPERDTVIKRRDYAEAGIPEYWIVNPEDETITVLQLEGDQYTDHGVFRRGDKMDSVLLPEFTVEAAAVFDVR